ncbi:3375_t:CDS:1, partial [Acaulospora colombiana]
MEPKIIRNEIQRIADETYQRLREGEDVTTAIPIFQVIETREFGRKFIDILKR